MELILDIMDKFESYIYIYSEKLLSFLENINFEIILKDNARGLVIGVIVASLVFMAKGSNAFKAVSGRFSDYKENKKILNDIQETMKEKDVDFERAKFYVWREKAAENLRIHETMWEVHLKLRLHQGERVTFVDCEVGLITGTFMGLIKPEIYGYEDIYVIEFKDGSIRQAPISYVEVDTINIYR